jgi:hypothetical protein
MGSGNKGEAMSDGKDNWQWEWSLTADGCTGQQVGDYIVSELTKLEGQFGDNPRAMEALVKVARAMLNRYNGQQECAVDEETE